MTSIKLILTGAQAWASVNGPLTSGMVGVPVTIEYDEVWDGLTKNLMCRCSPWGSNNGEIRTILNVGETSTIAHEVMQSGMYLYLGVEGFSSDGKLVIPTTWVRCGKIEYGANTCEDPSADPELSVWNQLQTEIAQIKEYTLTPEQVADLQACAQEAVQAAQEARQAADEAKQAANSGGSSLYYTPVVTQPTGDTLKFEFTPSVTGAPIPRPVTVELPAGEDSDENGNGGMSAATKSLLITILRNGIYSNDQSANITALANALESSGDISGGDDSGDGGETVTYTITNNLTEATTSNAATTAERNTAYIATLTAADGYVLDSVTVTMGGVDITDSVYADGAISIPAVTGNVVITATAVVGENTSGYVNLFDKNSMVVDGYFIHVNGYASSKSNSKYAIVPVEAGKWYALSRGESTFGTSTFGGIAVGADDDFSSDGIEYYANTGSGKDSATGVWRGIKYKGEATTEFIVKADTTGNGLTFYVPSGCAYVAFNLLISGGTDYSEVLMLETGDTCHDYVPYAG